MLYRQDNKNAVEWMSRLRVKGTECKYKVNDRRLNEQFMNGINDEVMLQKYSKN